MKYCSKCGKELVDDAIICTGCGCACDPTMNAAFGNNVNKEEDKVSVGLCVLAFFIPIFGLIYWAIKRQDTPKKANAIGITALISWGVNVVSSIIWSIVYAGTFSAILADFLI